MRVPILTCCLLLCVSCLGLESNPQPSPGKADAGMPHQRTGDEGALVSIDAGPPAEDVRPAPAEIVASDLPADVSEDLPLDMEIQPEDLPLDTEAQPEDLVIPSEVLAETASTDSVDAMVDLAEDLQDPPEIHEPEIIEEGDVGSPQESSVIGSGTFFGMCFGACKMDVTVDGDKVNFVASNWDGTVFVDNDGTLTPLGLETAQGLAVELVGIELDEVYGCPDCADGGGAYVMLRREGVDSKHTYSFGQPPADLEECDIFAKALQEALAGCQSNTLITVGDDCGPLG